LVVKRNRKDNAWQFPQGKWQEGETMRQVSLN
jgi:8-oxo-dGTP pyrophosphatase MutT (NUDIX family)